MVKISVRRPLRVMSAIASSALVLTASAVVVPASNGTDSPAAATARMAPRTWNVAVGGQSTSGAVQGMAYGPKSISINVGDTIHWSAASPEPHTVSFVNDAHPVAPFDPSKKYMVTRTQATSISAPGQFRNSGILATLPDPFFANVYKSYDLKFLKPGDYPYVCYVHGLAMRGVVHVRKAGTAYPRTQSQYNVTATKARLTMIEHGLNLWGAAVGVSHPEHVYAGAADMTSMVMRFIPGRTTVHVGDSVMFDMARNRFPIPHTVTFGTPPANPFAPSGDPTNYTGGDLSSGLMLPPGFAPPGVPTTFVVTFNKTGTYPWLCLVHDSMRMRGQVEVLP